MIPFLAGAAISAGISLLLVHLHEEEETANEARFLVEMVNSDHPPEFWVFKAPNLFSSIPLRVLERAAENEDFAAWFLSGWGGRNDTLGDDPVVVLGPHRVSGTRLNSRCKIDPEGVVRYLPAETPVGWACGGTPADRLRNKHSFLVAAETWRKARESHKEEQSDA